MAKNDNIKGVEKIEIGLPGDGVIGTSLKAFKAVVKNSTSLSGGDSSEDTIETEQDDAYLTLDSSVAPKTLNFKLYEVTGEDLVMLMGGEWDDATKTWKSPRKKTSIYLSVVLTTEALEGQKAVLKFPYAKVVARHEGNVTKNELLSVDVTVTANTPVSSSGVEGSPFELQWM